MKNVHLARRLAAPSCVTLLEAAAFPFIGGGSGGGSDGGGGGGGGGSGGSSNTPKTTAGTTAPASKVTIVYQIG